MRFLYLKLVSRLLALFVFAGIALPAFAGQGLFWQATSPEGRMIYLFGTIHTDDNRVTVFSQSVLHAIKSVDLFMMETEAPRDSRLLLMQEANLQEMLTEHELEKVYRLAEFHVMHRETVLRTKPWLLAVVFDSPRPLTPFAQDNLLMTKAEDYGIAVKGLATAEEHFATLDHFSMEEQLIFLRAVLKRTDKIRQRDYERLLQAYLRGNADQLMALNEKVTGGMLPKNLWQRIKTHLMDNRNEVMAERLLNEAQTKRLFVAVGASHLAGGNGLLSHLKRAGYTVKPVD
ncbi:MAG: TraB/GumN family protein [Betaproteobacteria bacterium HGW-Betaproteobacteria-22]|nr:MAG: TraB/GumN family protein [Betaproteobacteria bacterium HGW-Betaproteobacteria-22]